MFAEITLDCTGNCFGVQFKFIVEINLIQLALLKAIFVKLVGLGENARLAVQSFFVQSYKETKNKRCVVEQKRK